MIEITSNGWFDLIAVNPPRTQGATLSAWNPPDVTDSAVAAHTTTSSSESFSPVITWARYAPPAADAPEEPIPLHGLIPFVIFSSIPKSALVLFRTSAAAILTEFFSGSYGIDSEPGPLISVILRPDSIFLPSMMSQGPSNASPKVSNPAPTLADVAGAAILNHSSLIWSRVPAHAYKKDG